MNAIISGRSGRALLIDGDSLQSFEVDDPSTLTSRQRADLPFLFGEGTDLRILENTTIEDVEFQLRSTCDFTWALDLTLISLDAELPRDIRTDAVEDLEELLTTKATLDHVENILYAHPLPEGADLKGTLEICRASASRIVERFLLDLGQCQTRISEVCRAWELIPTKTFGSYEDQESFRAFAIREGLFSVFAKVDASSYLFFHRVRVGSSLKKPPNYDRIISKWYSLSHATKEDSSEEVGFGMSGSRRRGGHLDAIEREMIIKALRRVRGDQARAAKLLGITPRDLRRLLSNDERPELPA